MPQVWASEGQGALGGAGLDGTFRQPLLATLRSAHLILSPAGRSLWTEGCPLEDGKLGKGGVQRSPDHLLPGIRETLGL